MEEAFRAILLNASPVSAIVSGRINWGQTEGVAYPRVILTVIGDNGGHNLGGPDGLSVARVQVDCYAATYGGAKALGRAVRAALDGYIGNVFQGVFHAGSRDTREGGSNEADRPYRSSLDFVLSYNQS